MIHWSVPSHLVLLRVYWVPLLALDAGHQSSGPFLEIQDEWQLWYFTLGNTSGVKQCSWHNVFISVSPCQLGTHRQCEQPALLFDKQGGQGCGRQIRVPGKELLRWPVTGNTKKHSLNSATSHMKKLRILNNVNMTSTELLSLLQIVIISTRRLCVHGGWRHTRWRSTFYGVHVSGWACCFGFTAHPRSGSALMSLSRQPEICHKHRADKERDAFLGSWKLRRL